MINKTLIGLAVAALAAGGTYVYNNLLYNKDGYNKHGFDKDGYGRDGYDKDGFDRKGFDRDGFDCEGYDHEGFDKSGFNRFGVDREGYNRNGFDRDGYDRSGKDRLGYYKSGYNSEGLDRGGKSFDYYNEEIQKIEDILKKAHGQMKNGEFGYALHDIRIGLEKGVKCIITHWKGDSFIKEKLDDNITVCKSCALLPRDFIEELYDAKNHCNPLQHDTDVQKDYGQVHFTYKVLEELSDKIKAFT